MHQNEWKWKKWWIASKCQHSNTCISLKFRSDLQSFYILLFLLMSTISSICSKCVCDKSTKVPGWKLQKVTFSIFDLSISQKLLFSPHYSNKAYFYLQYSLKSSKIGSKLIEKSPKYWPEAWLLTQVLLATIFDFWIEFARQIMYSEHVPMMTFDFPTNYFLYSNFLFQILKNGKFLFCKIEKVQVNFLFCAQHSTGCISFNFDSIHKLFWDYCFSQWVQIDAFADNVFLSYSTNHFPNKLTFRLLKNSRNCNFDKLLLLPTRLDDTQFELHLALKSSEIEWKLMKIAPK